MLKDIRYGMRVLLKAPLFTTVAISSLALGIGGAVSVFTVLNAILLRDLPVPNPQQLYSASVHGRGEPVNRYSWPMVTQMRQQLAGRAEVFAATNPTSLQVRLPDRSDAAAVERSLIQLVSGEFFDALGQRARAGRLIGPDDNRVPGASPVAVISDAYWQRRFERHPSAVGRQILVGGTSVTIIGITEPGFFGPVVAMRNPDMWIPLMMQSDIRYAVNASVSDSANASQPWALQPSIQWLSLYLRLPDSIDVGTVESALTVVRQRHGAVELDVADADARADLARERVLLESAARGVSFLRGDLSRRLLVLLAMMGVLLLITCGNVASLLVARASTREHEIALRTAIGAGRWRIVRQLLAENGILALAGGVLGLLAAAWGRDVLLTMFSRTPALIDLDTTFDWRVLLFCVVLTVVCGLAAGVLPAVRGTRTSPIEAINLHARQVGGGGRRGMALGRSLVAGQIAFSLLLLVVAGLFIRSMQTLLQTDVGFDRDRVLVAQMDIRSLRYAEHERQALYERVLARLQRIPGVVAASASLNGPLGNSWRASSLTVEGYTASADDRLITNEETVTADYFETVGLRLVEGRLWTADDARPERRSTIVNETMARRFFPAGGAIGKRWTTGEPITADAPVIVGVVEDAKYVDLRGATPNMIYRLAGNVPNDVLGNLEIRTEGPPAALAGAIREAVAEVDPNLALFDVVPLGERLARGLTNDRLIANLTTAFGAAALLLACLGLYGTVAYGVARRVAELGIRMALGADRNTVLRMVIGEALQLVAIGAILGLPLAFLAGRGVAAFLYGVGVVDPIAYVLAAGLLFAIASAAAYLPAYRASRIDPIAALRAH